jgi:pyruvate/2-oxoglutarate dehydrogenase complex dihydrolipoamide dehydrogenase (E3) component
MLAHAASHQGKKVAEKIMGYSGFHSNEVVPSCIFVFPEIACVGISEAFEEAVLGLKGEAIHMVPTKKK